MIPSLSSQDLSISLMFFMIMSDWLLFTRNMCRAEGSIWIHVQKEFLMFAIKAFLFLYIFILSQPLGHIASMLKKYFNYSVYCIVLDIFLILKSFVFVIQSCTDNKKRAKRGQCSFHCLESLFRSVSRQLIFRFVLTLLCWLVIQLYYRITLSLYTDFKYIAIYNY